MSVFPMLFFSGKGKHIHNKIRKISINKKSKICNKLLDALFHKFKLPLGQQ